MAFRGQQGETEFRQTMVNLNSKIQGYVNKVSTDSSSETIGYTYNKAFSDLNVGKSMLGDTIVEVMLSMVILATALGLAYGVANSSLQDSVEVGIRQQGVAYAQEQVEYLKNAVHTNPSALANYQANPGTPFCIADPSAADAPPSATNDTCTKYGNTFYSVSVTYDVTDPKKKLFIVNTKWISNNPDEPGSTTLYYKPPQPLAFAPSPPPPPPPGPPTPPAPPPAGGCATQTFNATFPGDLGNGGSGTNTSFTLNINPPLSASCSSTTLTVRTIDTFHRSGFQTTQIHEQLFIEGHTGSSSTPVFTTGLTSDIPDSDTSITTIFSVSVTQTVNRLVFKHVSIHPECRAGGSLGLWPNCAPPPTGSINSLHDVQIQVTQTP